MKFLLKVFFASLFIVLTGACVSEVQDLEPDEKGRVRFYEMPCRQFEVYLGYRLADGLPRSYVFRFIQQDEYGLSVKLITVSYNGEIWIGDGQHYSGTDADNLVLDVQESYFFDQGESTRLSWFEDQFFDREEFFKEDCGEFVLDWSDEP